MRISFDIFTVLYVGTSSYAQPLEDQPPDLRPVGPTLGLPHHGAHDRTECLRVARADLLGCVRIGADRAVDRLLEPVAEGTEPALGDDLPRAATRVDERVENLAGGVAADLAGANHVDELGKALGGGPARGRIGFGFEASR